MATGIIKFFNIGKGFGFIAPDGGGQDVFVHISGIKDKSIQQLNDGQKVSYKMAVGRNGKEEANDVEIIDN